MHHLRIATRKSPLAWQQAETIKHLLQQHHPDLEVELVGLTTQGDRILDVTLNKIGGKGLFIKELEQAMLDGRADIAVHSMKDVTAELPEGFTLAAICKRHEPYDALVSNQYQTLADLPQGACIGTSSLRRQAQLKNIRPDLTVNMLRGNLNTRLRKLDNGEFDAIILAAAGLSRLGLAERISSRLSVDECLPAVGQGALGIECLADNQQVQKLLRPLQHQETTVCVTAERAVNQRLEGSCQVPIAALANLEPAGETLTLRARVGWPDGSKLLQAERSGTANQAEQLGLQAAEDLLSQGAGEILTALRSS